VLILEKLKDLDYYGIFPGEVLLLPVYWAAIFAKAHMRKYGTTEEQNALVAVKNRENAYHNHNAVFRNKISISDVMNSKKYVEPIKMLDCSYICNGASAILLTNEEEAKSIQIDLYGLKA
jgi:acetyl-CoA C-acetyltransferase